MSEKLSKKIKSDLYYDYLVKDIMNNPNFNKIKDIPHHNTTDRYTHSLNVSYFAYKIARLIGGDLRVVARSGLLHDFFYEIPKECGKAKERMKLTAKDHPIIAVINSKEEFGINEKEENAIKSHMYPLNSYVPKHKESWIINLADKLITIKEVTYTFNYSFNILTLFLLNWFIR